MPALRRESAPAAMFATFPKDGAELDALDRIEAWTRERFALRAEAPMVVTEVACGLPGCPPLETVVAFWPDDGTRCRFKVFKRAADVTRDDIPYAWLKDALAASDALDDACC